MKNKKLLKALATLTLSAAAASCVTLFGCGHKHEYSVGWSNDSTHHWHDATCEHDEKDAYGEHTWSEDGKCTVCDYLKPVTKYIVTFNLNGHGTNSTVEVEEGGKVSRPTDPTATGWAFGGWYSDAECKTAYDFEKSVTGNVTIYAKWTEQQTPVTTFTVTFDMKGHGEQIKPLTVNKDAKVEAPAEPAEEGWVFHGWYTDSACTTIYDFKTPVTANLKLYAKWVEQELPPVQAPALNIGDNGGITANAEGTEYTIKNAVDGQTYKISVTRNGAICDDVKVVSGRQMGNPLEFDFYEGFTDTFIVRSNGENVEGLTITIEEAEEKMGTAENPYELTVGEDLTVEGAGFYDAVFCTIEIAEAGIYTVTEGIDYELGVPNSFGDGIDESLDLSEPLEVGTYLVLIYGDGEITFKISKSGGSEVDPPVEEYETIETKFDYASATATYGTGATSADVTQGKFTFQQGVKFENDTTVNTGGNRKITIVVSGRTNTISFTGTGASSSAATTYTIKKDGVDITPADWGSHSTPNKESYNFSASGLEAGTYVIETNVSSRITKLTVTEELKKGTPVSITVSDGTRDFLIGSDFNSNGLSVSLNYSNGRQDTLASGNYEVISTDYKKDVSGKYTVTVKYTVDGKEPFTATYDVFVYGVDGVTVGANKIVKESTNTSYGNGVYSNHALKQLYYIGDELDLDGLTLILNTSVDGVADKTHTFRVDSSLVTAAMIEGYDKTQTGKQVVTVNAYGKEATFEVYVANKPADLSTATAVKVIVDKATEDAAVGTLVEDKYAFKTIQQALDFLESAKPDATKTIEIAPGIYKEKLEINIPKLKMQGVGEGEVKIEYNSLFGILDESGFQHVTDSTATLAVRERAVGFSIENITVSNYYNSQSSFDDVYGAGSNGERALAMLIQADQVTIDNCRLLGYQDTIELFTGRQFITNTYISGTTDFIFGTNNTTYFYNCEIRSIATAKNENGGYITAFKGNNKGSNDAIKYGTIFDECRFTADNEVAEGKTAIGRAWGANATVLIMNSELGAHISKGTGINRNDRYVKMNADPTAATVHFREYANTGAGAIDASWTGKTATIATAELAAEYSDLSKVFGTTDGTVVWAEAWEVTIDLTDLKQSAKTELSAYRQEDIEAIPEGNDEIISQIATIKSGAAIDAADSIAGIKTALADAKKEIDELILSTKSIEDLRAEALEDLRAYADEKLGKFDETADAELFESVNTSINENTPSINAAADRTVLAEALANAKEDIDNVVFEYEEAKKREGKILYEDFEIGYTAGQKLDAFSGVYGNAGVYGEKDGNAVIVANGNGLAAEHASSSSNISMIIDFGPVTGVVEGFVTLKPTLMGTKWSIVQFVDSTGKEIFALYTNATKDGPLQYRIPDATAADGFAYTNGVQSCTLSANKAFTVNFSFDLSGEGHKVNVSVNIDGTTYNIATDLTTDITDLAGIKLTSSSSGSRHIIVDDISVEGTRVELAEYKTKILAKLESVYNGYDLTAYTYNGETLTAAYNGAVTEINGETANTYASVIELYNNCVKAMSEVKTDAVVDAENALKDAKDNAKTQLNEYKAGQFTKEENKTAYETALAAGLQAIEDAATIDAAEQAWLDAKSAIDLILTDTDLDKTIYTVTFINADVESLSIPEGNTVNKPTDPSDENSVFVGWYTDDTFTQEFKFAGEEGANTITANTNVYAKWHALHKDITVNTASFNANNVESAVTLDGTYSGIITIMAYAKELDNALNTNGTNKVVQVKGGTSDGNKRKFEIDLTGVQGKATITVMASSNGDSARTMFFAKSNTNSSTNAISEVYSVAGKTPTKCEITVDGGSKYYFCTASSTNWIYSIDVSYETVTGTKELTDINGTVTLNGDTADLSNVTFAVKDGEAVTAESLGDNVTVVVSEDKTTVTVSYGKLSKVFTVTTTE